MKKTLLVAIAAIATTRIWAAPSANAVANAPIHRQAVKLFLKRQGDSGAAYIDSNLTTTARGDDRTVVVAEELLSVAAQCYNLRQIAAARDAATRSIQLASALADHGKPAEQDFSDLMTNIGVIEEEVFFDPDSARDWYQQAAGIAPSNTRAVRRLAEVQQKLQFRRSVIGR